MRSPRLPWAVVPVLCIVVGCAALVQLRLGWNDSSHFAQVRAFDAGTPRIDAYAQTTGDLGTYRGHVYSDKAPGLAWLTLPAYHVMGQVGVHADYAHTVHVLVIVGCLLPAALLLLAVCGFVDRLEPGAGPVVAVALGLGSLLLPFSTVFFSHVLAACLGFVAYRLLWGERLSPGAPLRLAAAGALAGLAVSTEYPAAILAVLFGAYVLTRPRRAKRIAVYGSGVLIGLLPMLAYDWWAFGSPLHNSYANVAANREGLLGLVSPSAHSALDLLLGSRGLLSVTPLFGVAIAGIVLLHREGRREEAWMAGSVTAAYLFYNASYYAPFGGWTPGPRFLIQVIPFLGLPLAVALRRLPVLTLALAAVSVASMIAATLTVVELQPGLSTSVWWQDLQHGRFGVGGGAGVAAWFALFAIAAIEAALWKMPRLRLGRSQLELALVGGLGWLLVARTGGTLLDGAQLTGELALLAAAAAVVIAVWLWPRRQAVGRTATVLLLALLIPAVARHHGWTLVLVSASLGLMGVAVHRAGDGARSRGIQPPAEAGA